MEKLDQTESVKIPPKQLNQVEFIYKSLQNAAADRGGFSMNDTKLIRDAKDRLTSLFTQNEEEISFAKSEDFDAFNVLLQAIEFQQKTGVWSFDSSIDLLNVFTDLSKTLDECKDPSLKLASLKKNFVNERLSNTQKEPNRGKGRGQKVNTNTNKI